MKSLCGCLLAAALMFQQGVASGRWVNVDVRDFQLLVLDIEPDRAVHQLIPAPQFSGTYSVEAGHLLVRTGDGVVDSSFVLRGDTLLVNGEAALVRLSRMPSQSTSVAGTWRALGAGAGVKMDSFLTFRSDGKLILEVGFPVQATVGGDSLHLVSSQGPTASFAIRQTRDTLYLTDGNKQRRFVRRPWGCLGDARFDAATAECRH